MKALILNSGMGKRMGKMTYEHPKCMTPISESETIISRQLRLLMECGIKDVIITTGPFSEILEEYCNNLKLPISITYVKNNIYDRTNYIYSIYCAREYVDDDILFMHGDLVFEDSVLENILNYSASCMVISTKQAISEKDFKAVIQDGRIKKIGVDFRENVASAQPLYKIYSEEWKVWLEQIKVFCENENTKCYAENAFNEISDKCELYPYDIENMVCGEVDNIEDLNYIMQKMKDVENRKVYMCFSTDMLHSGHISIINKAKKLGRLIIGVLSDEAVASYKRFPLLPFEERKTIFENLSGVYRVVEQTQLSYKINLEKYQPDFVVHGDDWVSGFQKSVRDEVLTILNSYGGQLVEYPYSNEERYKKIEARVRQELALPDFRRARLRKVLEMKGQVVALEAHSGITGLIAEKTVIYQNGKTRQFDAMWLSSLCDSTSKGKPDIELVDMTSRFRTIDDLLEVTTKPIIFDGDTGGLIEHFVYTVRTLERMGVSMIIIEDKTGLKKNSLFGTDVEQTQDSIENFTAKIKAGKMAQKTNDFMICARIESLILEKGMSDAIERAFAYTESGADAIMIHSRKKDPAEIFEFVEKFREKNKVTPLVVVPTSFNSATEEELKERGVNIVIYANQLTRAGIPAMQNAAKTILENHRALECDKLCMPIKEILTLIPEE